MSGELTKLADESRERVEKLRRPNWYIRVPAAVGLVLIVIAAVSALWSLRTQSVFSSLSDFFQGLEAAINDVIFLGIAIYFVVTIESRWKRRLALRALDELRSIAHIVDMHQLTKDPEHVVAPRLTTASSPARTMTRRELARYLAYCSESLAITSKLAALHVESMNDSVVLDSVNGIQGLTVGLSGKIWQKIMILDTIAATEGGP